MFGEAVGKQEQVSGVCSPPCGCSPQAGTSQIRVDANFRVNTPQQKSSSGGRSPLRLLLQRPPLHHSRLPGNTRLSGSPRQLLTEKTPPPD